MTYRLDRVERENEARRRFIASETHHPLMAHWRRVAIAFGVVYAGLIASHRLLGTAAVLMASAIVTAALAVYLGRCIWRWLLGRAAAGRGWWWPHVANHRFAVLVHGAALFACLAIFGLALRAIGVSVS